MQYTRYIVNDTAPLAPPPAKKSDDATTYSDIDTVPLALLERASAYWRIVYDRRRRMHDVSIRQILLGQFFIIVFVAGFSVLVDGNQEALLLAGSTLLLYPSLTDLLVSNSAVLIAGTHHQYDELIDKKITTVLASTIRAVAGAFLASCIVGLVAGLLGSWLFQTDALDTIKLAALAGGIAAIIGLPIMQLITFVARNLQSNPDEVTPPIENVFFNVLILLAIGFASRILA